MKVEPLTVSLADELIVVRPGVAHYCLSLRDGIVVDGRVRPPIDTTHHPAGCRYSSEQKYMHNAAPLTEPPHTREKIQLTNQRASLASMYPAARLPANC
jgi:hypothetical protein